MKRIGTLVGALAAIAWPLAGCSSDEPRIVSVQLRDPQTLSLSIDTCNADLTIDVVESEDDVAIKVDADEPDDAGDCGYGAVVTLQEPLGERTVTDANHDVRWNVDGELQAG